MIIISFSLYAQNESLYDANYDAPATYSDFNIEQYEFQKIYLQYEEAIKTITDAIRKDEKSSFQKEIERIKVEERQRANNSIEQAREDIYNSEIQNVRNEEMERLTQEISEKLRKELTAKISLEYELKKNQELQELEKDLYNRIYKENKTAITMVKDISFAIVVIILFIFIVTLIIKKLHENMKDKKQIEHLTRTYFDKLKTLSGQKGAINAEINQFSGKEKENAQIALERATVLYEEQMSVKKNIKVLTDLDDKFKSIYNLCIQNASDIVFIKTQCREFEININTFNKLASDVFNSSDSISSEEKEIFMKHHYDLENFATRIKGIEVSNDELKNELGEVAKKYEKCAARFAKGKI